jgi:hypothetical protein
MKIIISLTAVNHHDNTCRRDLRTTRDGFLRTTRGTNTPAFPCKSSSLRSLLCPSEVLKTNVTYHYVRLLGVPKILKTVRREDNRVLKRREGYFMCGLSARSCSQYSFKRRTAHGICAGYSRPPAKVPFKKESTAMRMCRVPARSRSQLSLKDSIQRDTCPCDRDHVVGVARSPSKTRLSNHLPNVFME